MTALPKEIAALDAGVFFGWSRTGLAFDVLAIDEASSSNVCRFWSGQTFVTKSSHFYTPFDWECAIVKRNRDWTYEGAVFSMMLPDAAGSCRGGTVPLYRLYNEGKTGAPNHRYTTSLAVRAEMVAQGWIAEGSGVGVMGCVPNQTPASITVSSPAAPLGVGDVMQMTATARNDSGGIIPGAKATWRSSSPDVATVSPAGLLTARNTGVVTITATINGVSGALPLAISPAMRVTVAVGSREVVFRANSERCEELDVPDQPPRIVRAADGSLVLFAGNAPRVYVSRGPDFGTLRRDCSAPVLISADRRTPESYENLEWLWDLYREGNQWHALIDNEFHDAVASTCQVGDVSPANPCWYNSVTYGLSIDGARSFSKPFAPAHVIAPPPNNWTPPSPETPTSHVFPGKYFEGYQPSIKVFRALDGYFYTSLYVLRDKSFPDSWNLCAIRTDRLDDPASWQGWDGSGFRLRLTSPYLTGRPGPVCGGLYRPLATAFNTFLDRYIQVWIGNESVDGKRICGVFFQLSPDLLAWSPPQLIVQTSGGIWGEDCKLDPQEPGLLESVPVMYAALIDHADPTVNFERPGRTPHLYYVRFNRTPNDPLFWLDRDVVRVPLTFTRQD